MEEKSVRQLKINKEFKNLIRPLLHREFLQLEANILADGCRDPIITWKGYIVDGHNRYEICTRHQVPFAVFEMDFPCKEAAIAWICANQLGRRNITEETRKFLIGMQYESEKVVNSMHNNQGHNQYTEPEDLVDYPPETPSYSARARHRTAARIASENHVSPGTVQKYALFSKALETIGAKEPDLVSKILSGRYKISHNGIMDMANMTADELKRLNQKFNRNASTYFPYSQSRSVMGVGDVTDGTMPTIGGIKEMPAYDPDSGVTELGLTIPSWIGSIDRIRKNVNLTNISPTTRKKTVEALEKLRNTVDDMLLAIEEAKP